MPENTIKFLVIILMALLVYSVIGPKIKEAFNKTSDRIQSVDYQENLAVKRR